MIVDKQSLELQGTTAVDPITEETAIPGVQHLYKATVTISKGKGFGKTAGGRRFICFSAFERLVTVMYTILYLIDQFAKQ